MPQNVTFLVLLLKRSFLTFLGVLWYFLQNNGSPLVAFSLCLERMQQGICTVIFVKSALWKVIVFGTILWADQNYVTDDSISIKLVNSWSSLSVVQDQYMKKLLIGKTSRKSYNAGCLSSCARIGGKVWWVIPCLCFKKKLKWRSACTPVSFFRPGSVHSNSASWEDCGLAFPVKLHVTPLFW